MTNNTIKHLGIVENIQGSHLSVRIVQTSACAACSAKGHCSSADSKDKIIDIIDTAASSYQVGEKVMVVGETSMGMMAVVLAFVLPFVLLIFSLFLLMALIENELYAALLSLAVLIPYYGAIALVLAAILYVASKKFAVYEDPRIAQVGEVLPQANCGGCGYPGCSGFADACVKAGSLDGKFCPVGGQPVMAQIADILGLAAGEAEPMVAVVRCNGTCMNRPRINQYDGAKSCAIAASLYGGETGCSYGCLGCGDCVAACQFDAIHMNPETGLPEVDEAKCTACGACVKACPKAIIEIRPQGKKSRRVYISCVNKDKGAVARKACTVSCIGCGKCVKTCPFEAITLENNLAYIDPHKCKSCRKCVEVCPQNTIIELNFPPRKPKEEAPAAPKPAAVSKEAVETPAPAAKVETPAEKATEAPKVTE